VRWNRIRALSFLGISRAPDEWEVVMSSFTKPDRAFEPLGRPI